MLNRHGKRNQTLRTKASFFGFTFALFAMVLAAGSAALFDRGARKVDAEPVTSYTFDNEDPEYMSADDLAASIKKVSITDTSQSISVTFSSSVRIYNNGRYNNVYVRVDDEKFSENGALAASDAAKEAALDPTSEFFRNYQVPEYNATVFKIAYANAGGNKSPTDIVIPEYINFLKQSIEYPAEEEGGAPEEVSIFTYRLRITTITSGVPFTNNSTLETDWGKIKSVTIPSSVETIEPDAFPNAAEADINFYCVDSKEEIEEKNWSDDWTNVPEANIHYEATFKEETKYEDLGDLYVSPTNTNYQDIGKGDNYILSCYPNKEGFEQFRKPLVIEYSMMDGGPERYFYEVPLVSSTTYYDGVGSSIGAMSLTINVDLPKKADQEISFNSILFHNIHHAVKNEAIGNTFVPDLDRPSRIISPKVFVTEADYFSDIIADFKTTGISTWADFTLLKVRFDFNEDAFKTFNHNSYIAHEKEIQNGTLVIRYQLNSIASAKYVVKYLGEGNTEKTSIVQISTPMSAVSLRNGAEFGFMLTNGSVGADFKPENLIEVELSGFSLHLDLYNTAKNNVANNSKVNVRFASLRIYDKESMTVAMFSIPLAFIIGYAIYIVAFLAIAFGLYFYRKNRFKNDEFRRVNKKKYIIESAKNFVGFAIVLAAVLCIIGRWGWLNNGVVVFNPLDPGVIIFTVLGGIFIGFTIRNIVVSIKLIRERQKKLRLKLDSDVVEDGTN